MIRRRIVGRPPIGVVVIAVAGLAVFLVLPLAGLVIRLKLGSCENRIDRERERSTRSQRT